MVDMVKYPSIENHYNNKFIERVRRDVPEDQIWVAREKIHGTNFQVIIQPDGKINFARRSAVLGDMEVFNDYQNVMRKYMDTFSAIRHLSDGEVRIFGELAGKGIQSNVPYGEKDFWVFDITIDGVPLDDGELNKICKEFKLRIAPFVKAGNLEELLVISPEFISLADSANDPVYDYEEPDITFTEPGKGNSEGYVFKPFKPTVISTGGRAMIKSKSVSHREKKNVGKVPKPKAEMTESDNEILQDILQYVTLGRVKNVYSHGEIVLTDKTFGKLSGLVIKDIIEEYGREHDGVNPFRNFENSKLVVGVINKAIIDEIKKLWDEVK